MLIDIEGKKVNTLRERPVAPKRPIQCPWCDEAPMLPRRLAQHIKHGHPFKWKGNIYETLPPDFDYGKGPLDPTILATLIQYGRYSSTSYRRRKLQGYKPREKAKSMSAVRRGTLGGLARARNLRAKEATNGTIALAMPKFKINECPNCGCPIRVLEKALEFVEAK